MAELSSCPLEPLQATHLELTCVSCGDHVNQLSCLPCLHSLAVCEKKECRQKLIERRAFCQHCKERFNVPDGGFPRYSLAERKAAARKMEEEGVFCYAEHSTPQVAVVFCSNCPGPLCEECHSGHRTMAFLKNHRIASLQDTMKEGLASRRGPLLCPAHKEELKCFCQDCKVLICAVCPMEGPHQSHSVLFVGKQVGKQNRQPLEECIMSIKKRIEEILSAVRDVDSCLLTLREESNRCKEDIADLKEQMMEAVRRRCAVLVAEVEEAEKRKRKDFEQHKKALEAQMKQLKLFKAPAEEIVQEGTTREQLSLRQAVIQRASSLSSIPAPPAPSSSSSVSFVSEQKEAEKMVSAVGNVSLGPAPEASSMEGLSIVGNTVECRPWSLPLNIRVVSRDSKGVEYVRGGERVKSALTPTSCGVSVQGEVEDRRDGTYQVTYRCLPSEECRLSVTVNGSDIRGSPVRVKFGYSSIIRQEIKRRESGTACALAFTKEGTLLATDFSKEVSHVCQITQSGEQVSSFEVANNGIYLVQGLVVLSSGNIAVSVVNRKCIAVYTLSGELVNEFGYRKLAVPRGLAVNHRGQLFVADYHNHNVCVFTENGEFLYSFGSQGSRPGHFVHPLHICISEDGLVYVGDRNMNNCIQVFQQEGHFVCQFGEGTLNAPSGLSLTKDGHIVVASFNANKLSIFTQSGECVHEVTDIGLDYPRGVAIAEDGSIFVAVSGNCIIVIV